MLIKLPEDMCTCSARISSSFTPAARLRCLEVGSRERKEGGDPLGHFLLKQATSKGTGQPDPQETGIFPQAVALTSGQSQCSHTPLLMADLWAAPWL